MIEKGYIEQAVDKYTYKVRIPRYNKTKTSAQAIPMESLMVAQICTLPGCQPYYHTGEVVWVELYNDQFSQPVILGRHFSEGISKDSKIYLDKNSNIDMSMADYITRLEKLEKKVGSQQLAVFG